MISITISGQTLEEFKNRLEEVAIQFLTEKENAVILNSSDVATQNGDSNEKETSKEASKKREVVLPEKITPEANAEGVKSLNAETSIKRKSKKISAKVEPVIYNVEALKENPKIDLSEMKLPEITKNYSEEEVTKLFKEVISLGREKAISILTKFGATKFSEVDPAKHQEFALECDKVLND